MNPGQIAKLIPLVKVVRYINKLKDRGELHKMAGSKAETAARDFLKAANINPDYFWLFVEIIVLVDRLDLMAANALLDFNTKVQRGANMVIYYAPHLAAALKESPEDAAGFLSNARMMGNSSGAMQDSQLINRIIQYTIWNLDDADNVAWLKEYRAKMVESWAKHHNPMDAVDKKFFPDGLKKTA